MERRIREIRRDCHSRCGAPVDKKPYAESAIGAVRVLVRIRVLAQRPLKLHISVQLEGRARRKPDRYAIHQITQPRAFPLFAEVVLRRVIQAIAVSPSLSLPFSDEIVTAPDLIRHLGRFEVGVDGNLEPALVCPVVTVRDAR